MTLPSTAVRRSFPGALSLNGESVPATVQFDDGSVSLYVAGDAVGTWPRSEIEFRPAQSGFEFHAEGDSLQFDPDGDEFERFLSGSGGEPVTAQPAVPEPIAPVVPPVETSTIEPAPKANLPEPVDEGETTDTLGETPETGPSDAEGGLLLDFEDDDSDVADPDEEPALIPEDGADEFFAAGLNGPPSQPPPAPFRSALTPPSVAEMPIRPISPPRSAPAPVEEPAAVAPTPTPTPELGSDEDGLSSDSGEAPDTSDVAEAGVDARPVAPLREPDPATVTDPIPRLRERLTAASPPEPDEASSEAPADDEAGEVVEAAPKGRLSRFIRQASAAQAATAEVEAKETASSLPDDDVDDDHLPDEMSDSENLRQWGIVLAGGVVVVAILAVVVWGLISMIGGEDPATAPVDTVATTVAVPPPTIAVTTTAPLPSTTVSPENLAAATAFVEGWNALAAQYAYHLTIEGDALPISTAPTGTVHLTYDEAGVLELNMAPKGSGSDRDILLAMGVAVAWADPGLSPEARRDVLAALGVDVDEPQVAAMGGELTRNGITYALAVINDVLRFEVRPAA